MNGNLVLNTSNEEHLILQGSSNPYIRFREGTTNKAFIQWYSDGYLRIKNQEDSATLHIKDNFVFSPDDTSFYTIWHSGNDGSGTGLDSDTVDGLQASSFLRSDVNINVGNVLTFVSGGGLDLATNNIGAEFRIINNGKAGGDGMYIGYNNANSAATRIFGGGATSNGITVVGSGNNDVKIAGNTVFHAGNDGSGSGLDSDTLDGVQGSSFLRSDAADTASGQLTLTSSTQYPLVINSTQNGKLAIKGSSNPYIRFFEGTTEKAYIQWHSDGYIQITNQEANESIRIKSGSNGLKFLVDGVEKSIMHAANDGSGSGFDSDTLDGLDSTSFVRSDAEDTITAPLNINAGTANGTNDASLFIKATNNNDWGLKINNYNSSATEYGARIEVGSSANYALQIMGSGNEVFRVTGAGTIYQGGNNIVFHTGNDGSGSGLDSDLLDGLNSNDFLRSNANDSFTAGCLTISSNQNKGLALDRNITSPSNYYNDLQIEVRATSGTAGIALHRNGNSHVGIYHDTRNVLDFDFNDGDVVLNHNTGTIWGSGNDGSGTNLDADTVDGIQASSFLRSDANDTATGTLTVRDITPQTNNSYNLGTSSSRWANVYSQELNITKASGNLSAIIQADSGLGTIEVAGSTGAFIDLKTPSSDDFDIRLGAQNNDGYIATANHFQLVVNSNENALYASANGSTELFFDGTHRLSTRDAGIDLHKGGEFFLKLTNTSTGQSDNTYVSSLIGMGRDDANNYTEYSKIITQIVDASNGTEDGRLIMQSMKDGSMTTAATVEAGYFQRNNAPGVSGDNFNWTNSTKYMHSGGLRFNTGDWNNSTGTFTCPVAGHYLCMATVQGHRANDETGASDQYFNVLWQKNNVNQFSESVATQHPNGQSTGNTTATHYTVSQCVIIQCSAGDTLRAYSNHGYRRAVQNQLSIMLLA